MSAARGGEVVDSHALRALTWMVGALLLVVVPAVFAGGLAMGRLMNRVENLEKAQCSCRDSYQTVPGKAPER